MHHGTGKIQFIKFCAYGFFKNLRFFEIFFILYLKEAGLSYLSIGLLYSIRQITINLMEVPSGLLADSYGKKRVLLISFGSYLVSFLFFYIGTSFQLLAIAMVLYGFGESFRSGTHKAIILHYLEANQLLEYKTRYYGSTRSWSQFGSAIVSLLSAMFFYLGTGYRTLFLFTIVPYIIDLVIITSYPADHTRAHPGEKIPFFRLFKNTLSDFISFFRSAESVQAMFSSASYIAFFKSTKDYLQPVLLLVATQLPVFSSLKGGKTDAIVFGISFFIIFLMTSYVSRNAYKLEEAVNNLPLVINVLYSIGVISIALAGLFIYLDLYILAVVVFVFLYLVQNIRRPLMVSFLSGFINSKILTSGLSAASQIETIIIVLFAPVLGFLIDYFGIGLGLMAGSMIFIFAFPLIKLKRTNS